MPPESSASPAFTTISTHRLSSSPYRPYTLAPQLPRTFPRFPIASLPFQNSQPASAPTPNPQPPAMARDPAKIGAPPSVASASVPTQTPSSATSPRPAPTNPSPSTTPPAQSAALSPSFNKPQRGSTPHTTKRTTPMPLQLFTPDMATQPTRPLRVTVRPDYRLSFNAE